jgi:osmotically-inducible protein OsmY
MEGSAVKTGHGRASIAEAPRIFSGGHPMVTRAVAATLIVLSLAVGCKAVAEGPAAQPVSDAAITAAVKDNLAADATSDFQRVNVETRNAVVTLTGVVDLWAERARAEQLAQRARGVKTVVNNLRVVPVPRPQ